MAAVVYALCAVTSLLAALLLWRGYRQTGGRLLLWSGLCFLGLTINNVLVFVDLVMQPERDLLVWRNVPALAGMILLIYGLIWDAR